MTLIYGLAEKTVIGTVSGLGQSVKEEHSGLIKLLNETKGKKIGIELHEGFEKVVTKANADINSEHYNIYVDVYNRLSKNNTIVLLDDKLLRERANECVKIWKSTKSRHERFRNDVEIAYTLGAKRTKAMFEKIQEAKPDLAFMGLFHAYELYLDNKASNVMLEIASNLDEVRQSINDSINYCSDEEMFNAAMNSFVLNYNIVSPENLPDNRVKQYKLGHMGNEQSIKRQYEWLFEDVGEKKPDFIGTFALKENHVPALGLFKIYLTERKRAAVGETASGTIEDFLGDATFEGAISKTTFHLDKHYTTSFINDNHEILLGCFVGPTPAWKIEYRTSKGSSGFYSGLYNNSAGRQCSGKVAITEYSPELWQAFISSKDTKELNQRLVKLTRANVVRTF